LVGVFGNVLELDSHVHHHTQEWFRVGPDRS
jgi:hypothetical protein